MNKTKYAIITTVLLNSCVALPLEARDATFAWDANPETDVISYRLEIFQASTQTWVTLGTVIDDPGTPAIDPPTTITIPNFPNKLSRLRAFAINEEGLESNPSEELTVMPEKPTAPKNLKKEKP
jgi:hypothetical protein